MMEDLVAWSDLRVRWKELAAHFREIGLRCTDPSIGPPVSVRELTAAEKKLRRKFPIELGQVYCEFARAVFFLWETYPDRASPLPDWCGRNGGLMLDFSATSDMLEEIDQWAPGVRDGPDRERYDRAFPFGYASPEGFGGGLCCIDGRPERLGQVILLKGSWDSKSEELSLAPNLLTYVRAITELAFPHPLVGETTRWVSDRAHGLDVKSKAGIERRRAFQLR